MLFLRKHTYLILGLLVGIVISNVILLQRGQQTNSPDEVLVQREQQQTSTPEGIVPDVANRIADTAKPPPPGETHQTGHWHGNVWHKTKPPTNLKKDGLQQRGTRNQKSVVGITWKGGASSGEYSCVYDPGFLELPKEIKDALYILDAEKFVREEIVDLIETHDLDVKEALKQVKINHGDIIDNLDLLTENGTPKSTMTDEEFQEREFKILTGDRDLESATRFLEDHGYYSKALLKRLNSKRAFEYLKNIETPNKRGRSRAYAEQVIAANPSDLDARLYLADTAPKNSKKEVEAALNQYQNILSDHPDSAHALVEAGSLLISLESPIEALEKLRKGHELGASRGYFEAAYAYQQLSDYKTAWVYLKKAMQLPHGERTYTHLRAIEAGTPIFAPLPFDKLDFPEQDGPFETPDVEPSTPEKRDNSVDDPIWGEVSNDTNEEVELLPTNDRAERARAAAGAAQRAREEFTKIQELRRKEFKDFLQWVETIMNAESPMDTNNFLMKEMEAFLKAGKPQFEPVRIVRAFEIFERYGPKEGIKRLQKYDPKVAEQVQRLLAEKRPHNPNNK